MIKTMESELNVLKETMTQEDDFIIKGSATYKYLVIFRFLRAIGCTVDYLKLKRLHKVNIKKFKAYVEYSSHDWGRERTIILQFCQNVGLGVSYNQNNGQLNIIAA